MSKNNHTRPVKWTGEFKQCIWRSDTAETVCPHGVCSLDGNSPAIDGGLREYTFFAVPRGQAGAVSFKCCCVSSMKSKKKCNFVSEGTLDEHFQKVKATHFDQQKRNRIRIPPGLSGKKHQESIPTILNEEV